MIPSKQRFAKILKTGTGYFVHVETEDGWMRLSRDAEPIFKTSDFGAPSETHEDAVQILEQYRWNVLYEVVWEGAI